MQEEQAEMGMELYDKAEITLEMAAAAVVVIMVVVQEVAIMVAVEDLHTLQVCLMGQLLLVALLCLIQVVEQ